VFHKLPSMSIRTLFALSKESEQSLREEVRVVTAAAAVGSRSIRFASANLDGTLTRNETSTSLLPTGVVVVEVGWLEKWQISQADALRQVLGKRQLADNDGADEESHEYDEEREVEHGVTDDSTLA
jgi:hypothetical protein